MKKLSKIMNEINELTLIIQQQYPELYRHLEENPLTIPNDNSSELTTSHFQNYLNSLEQLLQHHIKTHQSRKLINKSTKLLSTSA